MSKNQVRNNFYRSGKNTKQWEEFLIRSKNGENIVYCFSDYFLVSKSYYNQLINNKTTKIYVDEVDYEN